MVMSLSSGNGKIVQTPSAPRVDHVDGRDKPTAVRLLFSL
jgi:hypothetical protein